MPLSKSEAQLAAPAAAIVAPPVITYVISSAMDQSGLGIFSILLVQALGFAAAIMMLRPRASNAVLAALFYFPSMSLLIIWIGHRAGYYVMAGQ